MACRCLARPLPELQDGYTRARGCARGWWAQDEGRRRGSDGLRPRPEASTGRGALAMVTLSSVSCSFARPGLGSPARVRARCRLRPPIDSSMDNRELTSGPGGGWAPGLRFGVHRWRRACKSLANRARAADSMMARRSGAWSQERIDHGVWIFLCRLLVDTNPQKYDGMGIDDC